MWNFRETGGDPVKKNSLLFVVCLVTFSIFIGGCNGTQNKAVSNTNKYPEKPITMIVSVSAGGPMDLVARSMEKESIKYIGQPLTTVIKPGGSGVLGWNELASANPDGYTIGITSIDMLLIPLFGDTKYDYPITLDPIALVAELPLVLVVQADQPWDNITDFVQYGKEHPGEIKFGHGGVGSIGHIVGEGFAKSADIRMEQVPFRGASEAISALLGGHIQAIVVNSAAVKEHVKSGTIKVLSVSSEQRVSDPLLQNVPTFKEQGYDVAFSTWFCISAPKELPADVKAKLTDGFKRMIADPEFQQNLRNIGLHVSYLDSDALKLKWISDRQKLSKTIQETGILDLIKDQKK